MEVGLKFNLCIYIDRERDKKEKKKKNIYIKNKYKKKKKKKKKKNKKKKKKKKNTYCTSEPSIKYVGIFIHFKNSRYCISIFIFSNRTNSFR